MNDERAFSRSFFIVGVGIGILTSIWVTPPELAIALPLMLTRKIVPLFSGAKERSSDWMGARLSWAANAPISRPSASCAGTAKTSALEA